jgi:hypothetical protein
MMWAGRPERNMATRKRHTPEQVVRKLAAADRMLCEGKDVADVCASCRFPSRRTTAGATSSAG